MLGGTTVAASYSFTNKISVNDEVLTELDEIKYGYIKMTDSLYLT